MKKILLIEHNPDHSELIQAAIVQGLGEVKIRIVDMAKKGLNLMASQDFDLILSDYYLPDSRGEAHIRRLAEAAPETPVIIITGKGDEKTAAKSIQAGADDYIVKTRESLLALPRILNRVLAKHRSQMQRRQQELKNQLKEQEENLKQVLREVEILEEKMARLEKVSGKEDPLNPLESLTRQVSELKNLVQEKFFSGK